MIYQYEENQAEEDEASEYDWFYEVKFQLVSGDEGELIEGSERIVRMTPTEVIHLIKLVDYSLPALSGWHAMMDSSVVNAGNRY